MLVMALMGVRISWLMLEMNCDLKRVASWAILVSCTSSANRRSFSWRMLIESSKPCAICCDSRDSTSPMPTRASTRGASGYFSFLNR